jgi:peptidylprolyl isomerase
MNKRLLTIPTAILLAASIAACGSSSTGPKAAGIQLAPSGGQTVEASTGATTTPTTATATTPTTTTPAVNTPTSGPLSTEPKITVPKGPAPKNLVIKDLIKGTGALATKTSAVTVNYVGALYKNGKIFDASWNRKQTFPFTLGQNSVIPGWEEGVPGMRVGGRRELIIPAALAYGATGSGSTIPPNSPLIFVIDLLSASS